MKKLQAKVLLLRNVYLKGIETDNNKNIE